MTVAGTATGVPTTRCWLVGGATVAEATVAEAAVAEAAVAEATVGTERGGEPRTCQHWSAFSNAEPCWGTSSIVQVASRTWRRGPFNLRAGGCAFRVVRMLARMQLKREIDPTASSSPPSRVESSPVSVRSDSVLHPSSRSKSPTRLTSEGGEAGGRAGGEPVASSKG